MTTQLAEPLVDTHVAVTLTFDERKDLRRRIEVVDLVANEALSQLFEAALTVAADGPLGPSLIGERAALRLESRQGSRTLRGLVRAFEQGDFLGPRPSYRIILAPAAYTLALRHDCRVFQGRTAPEIIAAVLRAAGFAERDYRLSLQGSHTALEHRVQYRESDWSFLRRLLASEGIYFWFDHDDENEVMVFADAPGAHEPIDAMPALPFLGERGALGDRAGLRRFRRVEQLRADRIALRGHNFKNPRAALESQQGPASSMVTIYDAPAGYESSDDGARLARLRLEQEEAARGFARGTGDAVTVRPGRLFDLARHACDELNRTWLITAVEHRWSAAGTAYENHFDALPSDVVFRSPAVADKPVIGVQTAVVVGPPGQEIHCDELGRVEVEFPWQRRDASEEHAAAWVRVGQPWAGAGSGTLFVPRVGSRVLVDFTGGDCDRPIIVGSVYDGLNLPPASLPQDRAATILRSASTPGGEAYSELRFDADAGREQIALRSSRDLVVDVAQDKTERVVRDEAVDVGGDAARSVAGAETISVRGARRIGSSSYERRVGGDASIAVGGSERREVRGEKSEIVGEGLRLRVGGDEVREIAGSSRQVVSGDASLTADRYAIDLKQSLVVRVDETHEERAAIRRIQAGEAVELVCGDATLTIGADGTVRLSAKTLRVAATGRVEVEGKSLSVKAEGKVELDAAGPVRVRGRGVSFN